MAAIDTTQLIVGLAPVVAQYGPEIAHEIVTLLHRNQKAETETPDAYMARINPLIDATLNQAAANDAKVEAGDAEPPAPDSTGIVDKPVVG